ncbi:MAG: hypothetical protein IPM86_06940 [Saprospiraceae bacterium]|nr:hypothetical protein [Saprospiraceae bacterium]
MRLRILVWGYILLWMSSCADPVYVPKPRTFPRINFPEKNYQNFSNTDCPFDCEIPAYSRVVKDTLFFDEKPSNECWFTLYLDSLDALLARKHQRVANYLDEIPFRKSSSLSGMLFDMEGHAASPVQFYVTDSAKHFLRGSLYFHTQTRPDSLAPLALFLKEDIIHLMNTIQWK